MISVAFGNVEIIALGGSDGLCPIPFDSVDCDCVENPAIAIGLKESLLRHLPGDAPADAETSKYVVLRPDVVIWGNAMNDDGVVNGVSVAA